MAATQQEFANLIQYNIVVCKRLQLNYWGIPKSGNTTMKYILLRAEDPKTFGQFNQGKGEPQGWVHRKCNYTTPAQASKNGFKNFTVIRDPISRLYSMYNTRDRLRKTVIAEGTMKGIGAFYQNPTILKFLDFLEMNPDKDRNIHFRSQSSYCVNDDIVKLNMTNMESSIHQIHSSLSVDVQLNTSKQHTPDKDVVTRIREVFATDFIIWNEAI